MAFFADKVRDRHIFNSIFAQNVEWRNAPRCVARWGDHKYHVSKVSVDLYGGNHVYYNKHYYDEYEEVVDRCDASLENFLHEKLIRLPELVIKMNKLKVILGMANRLDCKELLNELLVEMEI